MTDEKKLSTTRIADLAKIESRGLFKLLNKHGWIKREDNHWRLTPHGEFEGGSYQKSEKYGEFIVWPESIIEHHLISGFEEEWVSATKLAEYYKLTPRIINCLFSELGWIEKDQRGWMITERGRLIGGDQRDGKQGFFVMWPGAVKHNEELISSIKNVAGESDDYCLDGHQVLCAGEKKIDNWLYLHHISHAYKRFLPGSELRCSFYLPERKVYIEFWGFDRSTGSLSQKLEKEAFYKEHGYKLLELHDDDLDSLDEIFPQRLLQFGMQIH